MAEFNASGAGTFFADWMSKVASALYKLVVGGPAVDEFEAYVNIDYLVDVSAVDFSGQTTLNMEASGGMSEVLVTIE